MEMNEFKRILHAILFKKRQSIKQFGRIKAELADIAA